MRLDDLSSGEQVFLDANILTFYFQPHPVFGPVCERLIHRIENQELAGFTSTHVLSEMAHRVMTIEAIDRFGWPISGIARRLRQEFAEIGKLTGFRKAVDDVLQSRIQLLTILPLSISVAAAISQQHGLLHNDALILAVMQQNGLTALASHDADFDRLPGITRYSPA